MHDLLESLNRFFSALPGRLRARRRFVWATMIVLSLVLGAGINRLQVDMSMESFFFEDDPVRRLHDRFKEAFGSDEDVYIVYEAADGDVFSPTSLGAVQALQNELLAMRSQPDSPLEHILDVTTLVNANFLEVSEDALVSRDFVEQIPKSEMEREALRDRALAHEDYPRFYLSEDSRFGGIQIRTDFGTLPELDQDGDSRDDLLDMDAFGDSGTEPVVLHVTSMEEYAEFAGAIRAILEKPEHSGKLVYYSVGNAVVMEFFLSVLMTELELMFAGAIVIMVLVLGILMRSPSGVLWPIVLVVSSLALTLGLSGWIGLKMSLMVSVLGVLLLVVGIADAVHILSGYLHYRRQGSAHTLALEQVYGTTGLACLLTSVTTAIGMLTLTIVPIPPVQNFGLAAAAGVLIAFGMTVFILPLMLDLWAPLRRAQPNTLAKTSWLQRLLVALEPFSTRWPAAVIALFAVIGAIGIYGVSQIRVDTNLVEIIRAGQPVRIAHDLVDEVMGGTQGMEIYLDFGASDALKDPRVMNAIEAMQRTLEEDHSDFVVRTDSIVNVVKSSFRALNENQEAMYRIPQDRSALAQTLLLYDLADPEDRALFAADDYREGRINVRMLNYGSADYVKFFDDVQARTEEIFSPLRSEYPEMIVGLTGNLPLMMRMADYVGRAQLQSFAIVLAAVTALMLLVFGSVRIGLVAMVPNVYPALMTFGVMGLLGIPLDADTLMIAPILIGIAVDDTIHFITHFRGFMLETENFGHSLILTLKEVGQAITYTSAILVFGFLVLIRSNHQGMASFGLLIGVAFAAALLADLLLLPSLLNLFKVRFAPEKGA